jgi:hypothetical protein
MGLSTLKPASRHRNRDSRQTETAKEKWRGSEARAADSSLFTKNNPLFMNILTINRAHWVLFIRRHDPPLMMGSEFLQTPEFLNQFHQEAAITTIGINASA